MGDRESHTGNPATLVAIVIAAHRVGNRELERQMRRQLEGQFGVKLSFLQSRVDRKGVAQ